MGVDDRDIVRYITYIYRVRQTIQIIKNFLSCFFIFNASLAQKNKFLTPSVNLPLRYCS